MLCYRFSDPGANNITERLIFRYGSFYYALDSLLPFSNLSYHKRVSHFRLERWLKKDIDLVCYCYGKDDYKFPKIMEQYVEDIPVKDLVTLCNYHSIVGIRPLNMDKIICKTKFSDVIPN